MDEKSQFVDLEKALLSGGWAKEFVQWFFSRNSRWVLENFGQWINEVAWRRKEPVVVEIHPDGYIEVYGNGVSVYVVNRLECEDEVRTSEEEYHRSKMPKRHSEVYGDARYRRASANVECQPIGEYFGRIAKISRAKKEIEWRKAVAVAMKSVQATLGSCRIISQSHTTKVLSNRMPQSQLSSDQFAGRVETQSPPGQHCGVLHSSLKERT